MRGILGADVFINLLLIFIITTGLLMMNSNRVAKVTCREELNGEMLMPKVDLLHGKAEGLPTGVSKDIAVISAGKTEKGVNYFLNDNKVSFKNLLGELKRQVWSKAEIRIDEKIPYGIYIRILDTCKRAGITEIYNVYKSSQERG